MVMGQPTKSHMGEMRFGRETDAPVNSKVTTRKMTQEEYNKYFGGSDMAITKEAYLKRKDAGQSDRAITEELRITPSAMSYWKRKWGLIGKYNGGSKSGRKAKAEEEVVVKEVKSQVVEVPDEPKDEPKEKVLPKKLESVQAVNPYEEYALEIADTLMRKNHDYGASFGSLFQQFGDLSAVIQLTNKVERYKSLIQNDGQWVEAESIDDTLRDLAGYAILTLGERKKQYDEA